MSLPRPLFLLFVFFAAFLAYAGSLNGKPIWDDHMFVFWVNANTPNPSHLTFWRYHIWPLFDSTAAILYKLWGANTLYWHVTNFSLHLINTILIGQLVKTWRPSLSIPLAILFFFHPLNVLSVAWIIQLKTLLCIFFMLLCAFSLRKWVRTPQSKWYFIAIGCFTLSVAAKSATLPIPWIALAVLIVRRKQHARWIVALIPFLLLTLGSTWRILKNEQVQTAVAHSEVVVEKALEAPIPQAAPIVESRPEPEVQPEHKPEPVPAIVETAPVPEPVPEPAPVIAAPAANEAPKVPSKVSYVLHNLGHYLFAPWFPWPVSPVHGIYQGGVRSRSVAGFIIALLLVFIGHRKRTWLPLKLILIQAAILVPYLGFIAVPYMSYTSVSEQHFYLVLPFTLALQLWVLDLLPRKAYVWSLVIMCVGFLAITTEYNQSFKNEQVFYERILKQRPYNTLATINLAGYYAQMGSSHQALAVINHYLRAAHESRPELQHDPLFPAVLAAQERYQTQGLSP